MSSVNSSSFVYNGTVFTTQVFIISISPALFNWSQPENNDEYLFRPSLLNAPDLPGWMTYLDSRVYDRGFIYGIPPVNTSKISLEIDGLSRIDYTSQRILYEINVTEKLVPPVENEVQIKITNVNIDDMLDGSRLNELENIFRKEIWPQSANDLRTTLIKSTTQMGERLPLDPRTPVGVVVWVGSSVKFSNLLEKLENETKPLRKLTHCPRDFKRTSMDRIFRDWNFTVDWCSFRLMNRKKIAEEKDKIKRKNISNVHSNSTKWLSSISIHEIPEKNYWLEFATVVTAPFIILIVLGLFLACIFYESDEIKNKNEQDVLEEQKVTDEDLAQYRSPEPLRSLSLLREIPDTPSRNSPAPSSHKFRPDPPPYPTSYKEDSIQRFVDQNDDDAE